MHAAILRKKWWRIDSSLCNPPLNIFFLQRANVSREVTNVMNNDIHDSVIKRKHFARYWPSVQGIHLSPVNSPHKGQWRGALMFLWYAPEYTVEQTIVRLVIWDATASIIDFKNNQELSAFWLDGERTFPHVIVMRIHSSCFVFRCVVKVCYCLTPVKPCACLINAL